MQENINSEAARGAVAAYMAASDAALASARDLDAAWRRHFESGVEEPTPDRVAEVAAQQITSAFALARAREATQDEVLSGMAAEACGLEGAAIPTGKIRRRRRRQHKLLEKIGRSGQRTVRGVLLLLLLLSGLLATGAGISLLLEVAGFLHLVDDPVRLPMGIQLAIFVAAAAIAFALRKLMKPVERALYGSKGLRPKGFQL